MPTAPRSFQPMADGRSPSLGELLSGLATVEGFAPTCLPDVQLMRSTGIHPYRAVSYDASIVIIAQGEKRGRVGTQQFTYDAHNYLVLSVPLPFECETVGTPGEPMLGLAVRVDPAVVAGLLLQLHGASPATSGPIRAIGTAPLTPKLSAAAARLADCLRSPVEARILGPPIVREITYHALCGPQGAALRCLVSPQSPFERVARALHRIHLEYAKPLTVSGLAREAGMSVSTFHANFKAVTGHPPQRYLQTVRLHKAEVLIAAGGSVAEAARGVGYESPSQFSREFKRLFGATPKEVADRLREAPANARDASLAVAEATSSRRWGPLGNLRFTPPQARARRRR